MSTLETARTKTRKRESLIPGPCQQIPAGLEWLASIAEHDAERVRGEIVLAAIERNRLMRPHLPKSPK